MLAIRMRRGNEKTPAIADRGFLGASLAIWWPSPRIGNQPSQVQLAEFLPCDRPVLGACAIGVGMLTYKYVLRKRFFIERLA